MDIPTLLTTRKNIIKYKKILGESWESEPEAKRLSKAEQETIETVFKSTIDGIIEMIDEMISKESV